MCKCDCDTETGLRAQQISPKGKQDWHNNLENFANVSKNLSLKKMTNLFEMIID